MARWLSGFADEVAPDIETQVRVFSKLELQALDVRSVDGINVLDLSDDQLDAVKSACAAAGLKVQAVGSPVNKVLMTDQNRLEELGKMERAIHAAKRLGTPLIRVFTPEVPEGTSPQDAWSGVKAWMREQIDLAEKGGVTLLHENDAKFYGAYPSQCQRLFGEFGGPGFRAAFDFANTVLLGFGPEEWLPWLRPHLHTIHIKDAVHSEGKIVPAGEGEGKIPETLKTLFATGWDGPLTLEPHLSAAGPLGGFSGEQLFETATNALKRVLAEIGA